MDTGARHRMLLSLRGEKALGLRSIRKSIIEPTAAIELESETSVTKTPLASAPMKVESETVAVAPTPAMRNSGQTIRLPNSVPFEATTLTTEQKRVRLLAMQEKEVRLCTKCRLGQSRTQTVFGEGDIDAKIMFIGEGPGENEDLTGRPFVGRAGQLLDKMIIAMGLRREQVYIANIVKCRPPENRVPAPDEVATCTPYLERQIEIIRPTVIVTLGRPAASYMLANPKLTMGSVRGQWHQWRDIKLMPTFHPSYVLRTYTEAVRKAVWDDLRKVMDEIGLTKK